MAKPTRDSFSFGMLCSVRGDTYREGKNPFTGEVVRFYNSTVTADECEALAAVLARYGINFDEESFAHRGEVGGTEIFIPDVEIGSGSFSGASIQLVGEVISDESLAAVLEMVRSANLYLDASAGDGVVQPRRLKFARLATYGHEEVLLVDTVAKLRAWLVDHVGLSKVI